MEVVTTIGGAILSASLQGLFDRLASHDSFNYARKGKVLAEIDNWKSMLKKIFVVLDDAEDKQLTNPLVRIWVSELRDLAYDVEDVIDEFVTKELQRSLLAKPLVSRNGRVRKLMPTCFDGMNPKAVNFNAKLISKMEGITARLEKIASEKNELNLQEGVRGRASRVRERQPTTSLVNEAKVYGREEDQKAVVQLLNAEVSGAGFCVIPIIGMGGIGKTTLAQLIFNDAAFGFDFKAWVSVGQDFDVIGITKTILRLEGCDANDLDSLQVKLKEVLSGKKFLIVLDDVWSEKYDDWTLLCGPFEAGAAGSRIIITTRNEGVSLMMGSVPAYLLKELSNDDCMAVFAQHALGKTNFDGYSSLEEIGEQIVKRCQGLPLAAKALGGLLRGKLDHKMWEEVLNSKIWDLPEEKSDILPALRLSYHHLPSHLKRCFAYCAIFPKDYEFDEKELVLLWMAEGFLQKSAELKPTYELGLEYFHGLLSRSFFQQSNSNKLRYVMHDLIRNLARSVNEDICFSLDDKQEATSSKAKVRHSSFSRYVCDVSQRFEVFHEMMKLRTFLALPIMPSSNHQLSSKVLHELVPKLRYLMVLSLAGYCFEELPSSIGSLKHLRYLNLSYTDVIRLPESTSKLFNLQTLKLRRCQKLTELPTGINDLINLQYLDISGTNSLHEMPPKIGNLTNLKTLPKFVVGKGHGLGIVELMKLTHLQGELHIMRLHNVGNIRDSELVNLKEKQNIDSLALEWTDNQNVLRNEMDELQVLGALQPHQNLGELFVKFYSGTNFPLWLGDPKFINMKHLELKSCRKITALPPLGQLPLLRMLSIEGMDGVKEVGVEFYGVGSPFKAFPSLETLIIKNMLEWEQWFGEEPREVFPNLCELRMRNCPKLSGKLPRFLPSLKKLEICDCPQLTELPEILPSLSRMKVEKCQEMLLRSAHDLISLTALKIRRIIDLVTLHELHLQSWVALEDLDIVDCHELMYLWPDGSNVAQLSSSMSRLCIKNCEKLEALVEGEEGILPCNLQVLIIEKCGNLMKLPSGLHGLAYLRVLRISNCVKLMSFPAAGLPHCLRDLRITNCDSLDSLPKGIIHHGCDINGLSHLKKLAIEGCSSLTPFPNGKFPDSLRTLTICYCTNQLLKLQHDRLSHLTYLEIKDCYELECFPEGGLAIPTLIYFTVSRCENLKYLPDEMQNLVSLLYFEIHDCGSIVSFPRGLPPNLTTLRIRHCKNLRQPISEWGLHRLTCLKRLSIKDTNATSDVVCFPDADGLLLPTSLTLLWIDGLENLKSISRGLQNLTSLESLWIWDCPKLHLLPKEGLPATLGYIEIISCPLLEQQCSRSKGDYWPIISHIPCIVTGSTMPLNPWFMSNYVVQTWGHA